MFEGKDIVEALQNVAVQKGTYINSLWFSYCNFVLLKQSLQRVFQRAMRWSAADLLDQCYQPWWWNIVEFSCHLMLLPRSHSSLVAGYLPSDQFIAHTTHWQLPLCPAPAPAHHDLPLLLLWHQSSLLHCQPFPADIPACFWNRHRRKKTSAEI